MKAAPKFKKGDRVVHQTEFSAAKKGEVSRQNIDNPRRWWVKWDDGTDETHGHEDYLKMEYIIDSPLYQELL